ncbi:autotransporter outer membrane beta-barrel domain-containing protein [Rhodobacterales bacterium HKCCSP123]|nr:autotransporter outer membrane beta-barrel domain-containing protein [Rhodobacterales bacterium HKCCSP123]
MATGLTRKKTLSQLALTTALSGMAMFSYGRGAYAGTCAEVGVGSGTFLCQGVVQPGDTGQNLSGDPLAVTTSDTFAIDVSGSAFFLSGGNGITFDTPNDWVGYITGSLYGIYAVNVGGGNILITTTGGAVTGTQDFGIRLYNSDSLTPESTITITTGDVTGGNVAIGVANNARAEDDTSITIDTTAGAVTAGGAGISVQQNGESEVEGDVITTVITGDVTTTGGTGIDVYSNADVATGNADILIDTTGGTIDSGASGIVAGNGNVDVETGNANITILSGNITASATGIQVFNDAYVYEGDTNIEIDTTGGTISSGGTGISVINRGQVGYYDDVQEEHYGSGNSNLTITAGEIGAGGGGIYAYSSGYVRDGDANITIQANGPILAGGVGIDVVSEAYAHYGVADISVTTTGNVTAQDGHGVSVRNSGSGEYGSNVTVTTTGVVILGSNDGIRVGNYGHGGDGASDVILTTGIVTGGDQGIDLGNRGYAYNGSSVTLTANGAVTGQDGEGIYIDNAGRSYGLESASNVTVTATDVTGIDGDGIGISNRSEITGSSNITVTTTGTVTSIFADAEDRYDGIDIDNYATAGGTSDITVTTNIVTGADDGISIYNTASAAYGSNILVTTNGAVSGLDDDGIDIFHIADAAQGTANVTVIANGSVTGYESGIEIDVRYDQKVGQNGQAGADIVVTTSATVQGQHEDGIHIDANGRSEGGTTNITVTTAAVTGGDDGIYIRNGGEGTYGSNVTVTTTAGAIFGGDSSGIEVDNYGEASGNGATSTVSITTGNVTGYDSGISVYNLGISYADTNVIINTLAGTVATTGEDGMGIEVRNRGTSASGGSYVSITTGVVTGTHTGIAVAQYASAQTYANVVIDSTGGAVSGGAVGINADMSASATSGDANLSVTTGNVTGGQAGIVVNAAEGHFAGGSANILVDTQAGVVLGTEGTGIAVRNYGTAAGGTTDITVLTGVVTGGEYGIDVRNEGDGRTGSNVTITSTGAVFATGANGINAEQQGFSAEGSANLTITTLDVTSVDGAYGINAVIGERPVPNTIQSVQNYGHIGPIDFGAHAGNSIVIDTTGGTVSAPAGHGIAASNFGYSYDGDVSITIDTANVSGGADGVQAANFGQSFNGNADVTVNTTQGAVSGGRMGIAAGLASQSENGTTNLTITTGDVTGTGIAGIFAVNAGEGSSGSNTVINTTGGTVSNSNGRGISAVHAGDSSDGTSNVEITTADVTTVSGTAIYAQIGSSTLYIDTGETYFEQFGYAGSSLTIDTTEGTVSSLNGAGIVARNDGTAVGDTDITVRTGDVLLGGEGESENTYIAISVINSSTSEVGAATLGVTTGDSYIHSVDGDAIYAFNSAAAYGSTDLIIDAVNGLIVSETGNGIYAFNDSSSAEGTSNLTITTTGGTVFAGDGSAILAENDTETGSVTINAGTATGSLDGIWARVWGSGGLSITASGTVTGEESYGIVGRNLGEGATAIVVNSGGVASGGTAGIYASHSSEAEFTITNSGTVRNASGNTTHLAIDAEADGGEGLVLTNAFGASIYGTVDLTDENDTFDNFGLWDTSGGLSDFGGGDDLLNNGSLLTLVVGNGSANQTTEFENLETFNNSGRIDFLDGHASDRLITDGDFNASVGSYIEMDFFAGGDGSDADVFEIGGDVSGTPTTIFLSRADGIGDLTGMEQNDGIALVEVAGDTDAGDFVLLSPAQVNVYLYNELVLGTDNVWRVQSQYLPVIPDYEVYPAALLALSDVGTYRERRGARAVAMGNAAGTSEVWMQFEGRQLERGSDGSTSETSYEQEITSVTVGLDAQLDGGLTAGVNLSFSDAATSMSSVHGGGLIDTTGWSLGGTLTWLAANGFYVDGQAQISWFDSDMRGVTGNSGETYVLSLEVGQEVALENGWSIVPQGQFSYTTVDFDTFTGSEFEETVMLEEGESLLARLGVSIDRAWTGAGGTDNRVYGMLNLTRELAGGTNVNVASQGFDPIDFTRAPDGTRVELGIGGTFGLANGTYVFGDLSASQGVDTGGDAEMSGRLGFNFTW